MRAHTWMVMAVTMAAFSTPAAAQDWNWRGRVNAGQWLEVKGVNGAVRAVASSGSEIEIEVTKSARKSDPDEVNLVVVPHAGGVTICAVYPAPRNREPNECRPGKGGRSNVSDNDVKVDFLVRVPANANFEGKTVNGSVDVSGLSGDVRAVTVNGSIRVSTTGIASATTVNGSIDVSMGSANWSDPLEFETVNGGITIELPNNVDTEVHASTVNGSISTDYPLAVRGRFGPKRISGTIGRGGRELTLDTVNGDIEIRKR